MKSELKKILKYLEKDHPEIDYDKIDVPFESHLSLDFLIEYWKEEAKNSSETRAEYIRKYLSEVEKTSDLTGTIENVDTIKKHMKLVDFLMSAIYLPKSIDNRIMISSWPLMLKIFYGTEKFKEVKPPTDPEAKKSYSSEKGRRWLERRIINTYSMILQRLYGINIKEEFNMTFKLPVKGYKTPRTFKLAMDARFAQPIPKDELPHLSKDDINELLNDVTNIERFFELLPPDKFYFKGFKTFEAIDITDEEVLTSLNKELLDSSSYITSEKLRDLEDNIRLLFDLPQIKVGLISIPENWDGRIEHTTKIGDSLLLKNKEMFKNMTFEDTIFEKALLTKKTQFVKDIDPICKNSVFYEQLKDQDVKSLVVAPLLDKGKPIGIFEMGSSDDNALSSLCIFKLGKVLSLFTVAVRRSMEQIENTVQRIIKEECTAIHPSVEWRFRNAAYNLMRCRENNEIAEMEKIVFDNVYPLYGLSDIRNSSIYRNETIKEDLSAHINLAVGILENAKNYKPMPLFDELIFRLEKFNLKINNNIGSGDEVEIIDFINEEIDPIFAKLRSYSEEMASLIDDYNSHIDPKIRSLYNKRRQYDKSISIINESISNFLDKEEHKAQEMFPHYFEKYKTDGVEHGIYIGQSLVHDQEFSEMYLKNLRLWQLLVMCGIVKICNDLKSKIELPLDSTHLVLVQDTPLSIRFRPDEKKFDVDGTYNMRYEIMKKRIDKALIINSNERLTQPDKIAIVYSNDKEAAEYARYLEYLHAKKYITNKVEELQLDELQGVSGLRAFRAEVNLKNDVLGTSINSQEINDAIKRLENVSN